MKIAILYICLGKYDIFWRDFYESSLKYFVCNSEKDYFVFTDSFEIYAENKNNVFKLYQNNLGWPGNTLFRFNMFSNIKDKLENYDYIFFFNANALFVDFVTEQHILPEAEDLVVVQHPSFYDKKRSQYPYEKNPNSLAYIARYEGKVYVQGCLSGGKSKPYIDLINTINNNTKIDNGNNIVATWHDESHLNKYIMDKNYKLLSPGFSYPENWNIPFNKKIIMRDKARHGGHDYLRGITPLKVSLFKKVVGKFKYRIWRS